MFHTTIKYCILLLMLLLADTLVSFAQPATPKFQNFQSLEAGKSYNPANEPVPVFPPNPILANSNPQIAQQNLRILQQAGMPILGQSTTSQQQQLKEVEREEKMDSYSATIQRFQNYLYQLQQLNPDSFSITKAVYLSEAAYYDQPYSYTAFKVAIQQEVDVVKQILKREGLSVKNNTAINYAIQKLYTQTNSYYNSQTKCYYIAPRLSYDFDDFYGENDWTKMFVTKLLQKRSGQCHCLPLNYLCVAEQLHAKAWLSLAPNHSFIQYFDDKGRQYNFETTGGGLVSVSFIMQSTFINATALKNKTYLDTLSSRKLYAQCLGDLLMNYEVKIKGDDNFSRQLSQQILAIDSNNITALMAQSNYVRHDMVKLAIAAGNPAIEQIQHYPELYAAYQRTIAAQQKIQQTGFQEMPKEAYEQWLASLTKEKQKEQGRKEQERMQREISTLKKLKTGVNNHPKQ